MATNATTQMLMHDIMASCSLARSSWIGGVSAVAAALVQAELKAHEVIALQQHEANESLRAHVVRLEAELAEMKEKYNSSERKREEAAARVVPALVALAAEDRAALRKAVDLVQSHIGERPLPQTLKEELAEARNVVKDDFFVPPSAMAPSAGMDEREEGDGYMVNPEDDTVQVWSVAALEPDSEAAASGQPKRPRSRTWHDPDSLGLCPAFHEPGRD